MGYSRTIILLYKDALKTERKKTSRYRELLDVEMTTTSKLQKRLDRAKGQPKRPGQEAKWTQMMQQLGAAAKERDEMHD